MAACQPYLAWLVRYMKNMPALKEQMPAGERVTPRPNVGKRSLTNH